MNSKSDKFSFQELPSKYFSLKRSINDENMIVLYSKFSFQYLIFSNQEENIYTFLYDVLKEFKLLTYEIIIDSINDINIKFFSLIICGDNQCFIIESIERNPIDNIIKKINSNKIDVCLQNLSDSNKKEILSFCSYYKKQIHENLFIKITIKAIIGFIIQKNFYPSRLFKSNIEFVQFDIDKMNAKNDEIRRKLNYNNNSNMIIDYNENDFIKLRIVYSKKDFDKNQFHVDLLNDELFSS